MSDPMAEIKASFFIECEELLEALQDGLQSMYDGEGDAETVNVVFRAVHSIKGGAGAFGLDGLVGFAHRFETALDDLRSGKLDTDPHLLKLFFTCNDVLGDLVRECRDEVPHDSAKLDPVLAELDTLIGGVQSEDQTAETVDFEVTPLSLDLSLDGQDDETVSDPIWKIRFQPGPMLYANGNEPLFLFRALRDIGDLSVTCDHNDLPPLAELDCEHAHIGWTLTLETTEGRAAIAEAFDFVEGLCTLDIKQKETGSSNLEALVPLPPLGGDAEWPADNGAPDLPRNDQVNSAPTIEQGNFPEVAETPAARLEAAPPAERKTGAGAAAPRATVRVDLDRIDRLVNLVGEIVINQAMLSQSVQAAGIPPNSPVSTGLEEFQQLTRDIQESVMMIRAQPVKSLFQRMSRIVREASAAIGKDVRLRTDGENTEVDKTVIERLADPLTHMIRNAVDHGLEANDVRERMGKAREGSVFLTAVHRSGRVVIEVADDGAGIDRDKVFRKAVEKDLIPADSQLSDGEIDNLLFLPGFSTADEVSNLSGRGVGMDVVRSAIQSLGGRISIQSEPGHGTTFSISLPLTLAVLDGMVVNVAGETLVVPLNSIFETLAVTQEDLRAFGPSTHVVNIRDSFVPLIDLGAELGYRAPLDDYTGGVVLLIGQEDGLAAAVVVDAIEDQRQVVIKGLQESYGRVPGIAAATILGDGQIALILDPIDLITQASGRTRPKAPRHQISNHENLNSSGAEE
ncbi:chemotaxis protein CheA [uncultured Maritimibacter sp.]|uniref:chemotaxis protein CheA n=2 Tax=Maritimibacter TaxID=404235 RepID=UPI0030D9E50E|tara:strand:+ start:3237 stop:5456 length:2220 start_codon:yes stop_codon:yes gene_type:complete